MTAFARATIAALFFSVATYGAETRLDISVPPTTDAVTAEVSPDGKKILVTIDADGKRALAVHTIASHTTKTLPGTDDIANPFPCWSPDSESVAFFSPTALKRMDLETGVAQILASVAGTVGRGCTWNREGAILFAVASQRQILRISDGGGSVQAATPPDVAYYSAPRFLPDGRHFLFFANAHVYLGELSGVAPRQLLESESAPVYSPGQILFVRKTNLYAQQFDPEELTLRGDPVLVASDIPMAANIPAASASADGTLLYRSVAGGNLRHLKWFDRTGKELESVGEGLPLAAGAPALSPNGRTLALNITKDGNQDVWFMELASGKMTRFTTNPANDGFPVWSTDGKTIYYSSAQTGQYELYQKAASGDTAEELVLHDAALRLPEDISPDGRFVLLRHSGGQVFLQLDGNPPGEFPIQGMRGYAQFSPDGLWIADQVEDSGHPEVFIQQFPSGRRIAVSSNGGGHVRWGSDGKELFFIASDGKLMAVPVELGKNGEVKIGMPSALFTPPLIPNVATSGFSQQYIVSKDGKRFLIATVRRTETPITVVKRNGPAGGSQ